MTDRDLHVFAGTIFGEARGESLTGKVAVAYVIVNRSKRPSWPDDIAAVCLQPKQFSCWNEGDPNRVKCATVDLSHDAYADCLYAALAALTGHVPDPTSGADHYYATSIDPPRWTADMTKTAQVGNHLFFRA